MSEEIYFNKRMLRLGQLFGEISKWMWLTIFLFWLVFPLVILPIFIIRLFLIMNDLRMIQEDDIHIEKAIAYLLVWPIGLVISVILVYVGKFPWLALIGILISILLYYAGWKEFALWSESLTRSMPMVQEFHDGIKTVRTGSLLLVILVGIFVIPIGLKKASRNLVAVFGNTQKGTNFVSSEPQPVIQTPTPTANPFQTPNIGIATERVGTSPASVNNAILTHCPKCGVQFPKPGVKFCGACGYRVN